MGYSSFVCEDEKKDWKADDKIVCISNMLPCYPSELLDKSRVNHRVISVGRYAYQKGYDMLVNSWEYVQVKHPDWSLHIYGSRDGDRGDYESLKKKITTDSIQNVFLHPETDDVFSFRIIWLGSDRGYGMRVASCHI